MLIPVPLGCKDKVTRKFRITVECSYTLNDVAEIEVKCLPFNANNSASEAWMGGQEFSIDDLVEVTVITVREVQGLLKLYGS